MIIIIIWKLILRKMLETEAGEEERYDIKKCKNRKYIYSKFDEPRPINYAKVGGFGTYKRN